MSPAGPRRSAILIIPCLRRIDDLGWADVVWHKEGNPDVQQPHVAELVKEAIILDRHYTFVCARAAVCLPAHPLAATDRALQTARRRARR